MRVLIGCEESQAVTIEFRKLGIEAFSCDILPCSGGHPEWHLQQDVTELLLQHWDLIIAFPPCTHLCVSGAKHFEQKRKDGRQQQGIDFFMLFAKAKCELISIENPIGIMSNEWRKPDQIIQPYQFGDPVKKTTCLWLKGLPKLKVTEDVENEVKYYTSPNGKKMSEFHAKQIVVDGKKYGYHTEQFKKHRSKTFPGIAKAMADQWGYYLLANDIL
jgi:site-specific DNA-cytosine methylase